MNRACLAVLALVATSPALAQMDASESFADGGRQAVAEGNNWSISGGDCAIDASWVGDDAIVINAHDDHHDLGVYNPGFKGVVDGKVIPIRFAAAGAPIAGRDYEALGHRSKESTGYVSNVDDALLDRIAAANSVQVHRGKTLLADLDLTGLSAALGAMRSCEIARGGRVTDEAAAALEAAAEAPVELPEQQEPDAAAAAAAAEAAASEERP